MNQVGIIYNPQVPEASSLGLTVAEWLRQRKTENWVYSTDEWQVVGKRLETCQLLIVLGGDGTTLLAGRLTSQHDVPVFGVNLGRVGFLSEANPDAWQEKLAKVLNGDCWIERRLMLQASVIRNDESLANLTALNDIVVSRGGQVRVVRFHLFVDNDHVTTYTADALITATPTGSTAYSMAAGGPLLPPQLQNFLVLPVAPHLSFERPLVLHQEAKVKIKVQTEHVALVTADGQNAVELQDGDEVVISKHQCDSLFARVDGPSYFYNRLMQRLSYWSLKH
jgi:NAD+ kinase